jgi:hypothetical protein
LIGLDNDRPNTVALDPLKHGGEARGAYRWDRHRSRPANTLIFHMVRLCYPYYDKTCRSDVSNAELSDNDFGEPEEEKPPAQFSKSYPPKTPEEQLR